MIGYAVAIFVALCVLYFMIFMGGWKLIVYALWPLWIIPWFLAQCIYWFIINPEGLEKRRRDRQREKDEDIARWREKDQQEQDAISARIAEEYRRREAR